ncbi:MAG: tetratricopeptide repeat protein [Planctomycetota bacterium]|jgi:Flp pilus assembly protein TadD
MRTRLFIIAIVPVLLFPVGCTTWLNQRIATRHYMRGTLLADSGDLEAALAELNKAIENDPKLSLAHNAAGDIYRKQEQWEFARISYENACRTDPYAFLPHYHLALTYQTLAHMSRTAGQIEEYLLLAVRVYLRAITLEPEDFEANLNIAACYFQLGKFELAEQYCKSAIAVNPRDPNAYSNLGVIYDSQDRFYDAIRAYKTSLEIDTHQPKLLLNLGITYMRQNRLKRAINAFNLSITEEPCDPAAWEQVGSCHYRLGEYDEALSAYSSAISLNGDSAAAHRGLGVVYMSQFLLNQRNLELRDKGLAAWHTSLEIKPHQPNLRRLIKKYSPRYAGMHL